ncbi:MAG: ABC transporter permease [Bacteroidota bacterium]
MKKNIPNLSLYVILMVILVIMTFLNPTRFFSFYNFSSMAYQLPFLAFLSMGQMVTILSGGINLAIIATANFSGIITAILLNILSHGNSTEASVLVVIVSILGGLIGALLAGALSGYLIGYLRVPDILATLGVMILLNGVNIILTKGYTITGFPDSIIAIGNGTFLGIPIPFFIFLILTIFFGIVLNKTIFGYSLYMMGSNYTAAKFSGIGVRSVILKEYLFSSLFAAITAFIMMGQLNSVKANYGDSYLLVSILACFLGGVNPLGGSGNISGLLISVLILQVVSSGVNLLMMDPFFIRAMWGFIMIAIIFINYYNEKKVSLGNIKLPKTTTAND